MAQAMGTTVLPAEMTAPAMETMMVVAEKRIGSTSCFEVLVSIFAYKMWHRGSDKDCCSNGRAGWQGPGR